MSDRTTILRDESPDRILGIPSDRLAVILLFVVPALFSSNMLVARAVANEFPPIALAFWRWAGTLILLSCIVGPRLWVRRHAIRREWRELLVLGALGMGVCGAFVYYGAQTTTATNIGLIYAASPVTIILLAAGFLGERMKPTQLGGVAICLIGVVAIICRGDPGVLLALDFKIGDLWIVAAMLGWSIYSIVLRARPSEMGVTTRLAAITGGGILVLLPFTIWEAMTLGPPEVSWRAAGTITFLALVPGFAAYQCYGFIQSHLGASRTGVVLYLAPVYTAGLAYVLLGETLQAYHFIGAALVLPGVFLSTRGGAKRS